MLLRAGPPGHSDLLICVDYINAVLFTKHPSMVTWCEILQIWSCALLGNYGNPSLELRGLTYFQHGYARTGGRDFLCH